MLSLGLVWCCYFLVLGIVVPAQVDYANDMAELIVSVLTVMKAVRISNLITFDCNDKNIYLNKY